MIDRISIDLSNFCSKQCDFCYNHSSKEGNVIWKDEMYVSVTSNGLPLENEECFSKLMKNKPDKIHITIHQPENKNEVDRVIKMVNKIASEKIKSGVNLLVSDFNTDESKSVYLRLLENGITADRIILIPRRFSHSPTAKQLSEIACGKPFQSPSCLTGCKQPTEFCSVSWDKKVNWCSYAKGKQPLKELSYKGLMDALNQVEFECCNYKLSVEG